MRGRWRSSSAATEAAQRKEAEQERSPEQGPEPEPALEQDTVILPAATGGADVVLEATVEHVLDFDAEEEPAAAAEGWALKDRQ